MKYYLYGVTGKTNEKGEVKKFKVTLAGKKQLEANRKLVLKTVFLGECNEKGVLLAAIPVLVAPPKEIEVPVLVTEIKEAKFVEPVKEKRKYEKRK